jgi:acyl-CoA thioesterase-1
LLLPIAASAAPVLLVFGDSLSAGYGLDAGSGWVTLLSDKLKQENSPYTVINASVSGETSAGGLARLPAALARYQPEVVLIELGANDGLRGLPLPPLRENLQKMITLTRTAHASPVLFDMRIPTNYGPVYADRFARIFGEVAQATATPLVPFFLSAIATERDRWFQPDGLHPNAQAQPLLLKAVWPTLAPILRKSAS